MASFGTLATVARPRVRDRIARLVEVLGRGRSLLLVVVGAAVALRIILPANTDVSWLITIGEKMLDGQRLYVDVLEVNPPASALLYLLPVALARLFGLAPELLVDAFVLVAAAASIGLSGHILAQSRWLDRFDGWRLAAWTAAILTVLPMQVFGEREHIAVIVMLPLLAAAVVRAGDAVPPAMAVVVAGLGAGITVIIKPHFAIPVGAAMIAAAVHARSWRPIFAPENWIAAALAAVYGAWVLVAFPEFLRDIVPLVQAVYLPVRAPSWKLVADPTVLATLATWRVLAAWRPGELLKPPYGVLLAASAGFAVVYFIQGKGWPYHSYPILATALVALAMAGLDRLPATIAPGTEEHSAAARWLPRITLAAVVVVGCAWMSFQGNMGPLVEPIRKLKPQPTMLAISADFSTGHPLAREVGGTWVSRVGSLWISSGVFHQLVVDRPQGERLARLRRYATQDRDWLIEDIRRAKPDIILVERHIFDWYAWAQADPLVSEELKNYEEAGSYETYVHLEWNGTLVILRRKQTSQ